MYQPRLGDPLDALDTPAMIVDKEQHDGAAVHSLLYANVMAFG